MEKHRVRRNALTGHVNDRMTSWNLLRLSLSILVFHIKGYESGKGNQ